MYNIQMAKNNGIKSNCYMMASFHCGYTRFNSLKGQQ